MEIMCVCVFSQSFIEPAVETEIMHVRFSHWVKCSVGNVTA